MARERNDDDERMSGFEIRTGKIISSVPLSRFPNVQKSVPNDSFTVEIDIHYGDSGLPLFAWKNKEPVITGVVHSIEATPMFGSYIDGAWAFIARTDSVYRFIEGNKKEALEETIQKLSKKLTELEETVVIGFENLTPEPLNQEVWDDIP